MINRGALLLRYKDPAIRWINEADPTPRSEPVTAATVNEERTVYLVTDSVGDSKVTLYRWLQRNYVALFEKELEGWHTDPTLWPSKRTFTLFQEWFEPECHTVLIDLGEGEIVDESF